MVTNGSKYPVLQLSDHVLQDRPVLQLSTLGYTGTTKMSYKAKNRLIAQIKTLTDIFIPASV